MERGSRRIGGGERGVTLGNGNKGKRKKERCFALLLLL